MRKLIVIAASVLCAACSYVPPESVAPVAEVCQRFGMTVLVGQHQISCYKRDE